MPACPSQSALRSTTRRRVASTVALSLTAATFALQPFTASSASALTLVSAESAAPTGQVASDAFDRAVAAGFGVAGAGGTWTTDGTTGYSVAGGAARILLQTPGRSAAAYLEGAAQATDTDLSTTVSLSKAATGGGTYVYVVGRRVGTAGDYRLKLAVSATGTVTAWLERVQGGETLLTPAHVVATGYVPGTPLHVALRVRGTGTTTLFANVWTGSSAPIGWALKASDSTPALQVAGVPGVVGYLSGSAKTSAELVVQDLSVTTPVTAFGNATSAVTSHSVATGTTFSFTANTAGSTFQCKLDAGPFAGCTGPVTYGGLADGAHSFSVRAVDSDGYLAPPVTRTWTVDTTAPTLTLTDGPAAGSTTRSTSTGFTVASNESATLECQIDGGSWNDCDRTPSLSALGDGSHTFAVRGTDEAGNTSPAISRTWTVDSTAPRSSVVAAPTADALVTKASMTAVLTSSEAGTFECRLDSAAWAACTSPVTLTTLAAGSHTFSARATDRSGNVETAPPTATWTTTAPAPAPVKAPTTPAPTTPAPTTGKTLLSSSFDSYPTGAMSLADFKNALHDDDAAGTSTVSHTTIVAAAGHGNVMRQHFDAGSLGGVGGGIQVFANGPLSTGTYDDATLDYDVRFAGNFDWGWGGKLPGLGGVNNQVSPGTPTGGNGATDNGWSGRMMWNTPHSYRSHLGPNEGLAYVYHPGQADNYGDNLWTGVTWTPDLWHHIKARYKMNTVTGTVGNHDGILQVWFDGQLVVNRSDYLYRNRTDVHITHLYWHLFYGGGTADWAPHSATDIDTDNLTITAN